MNNARCADCKFWTACPESTFGNGCCGRNAPAGIMARVEARLPPLKYRESGPGTGSILDYVWPETRAEEWCGEFAVRAGGM